MSSNVGKKCFKLLCVLCAVHCDNCKIVEFGYPSFNSEP
jgi:hypothetical protein